MQNAKWCYSARSIEKEDLEYKPLAEFGLVVEEILAGGNGNYMSPYEWRITIRNEKASAFEGVIHLELVRDKKNPKFFLPGFMYGRNRGETPMYVLNEFPRMRSGELHRPASPWWMVRGDRLSHPAAFIYDEKRITGLSAVPYWEESEQGKRQTLQPGKEFQYGGFSCNLEYAEGKASVGYTLGYENAPWLFIQSHTVLDRAKLAENCIRLESNESITTVIYCYDYEAKDETCLHKALQEIYYRFHQQPRKIGNVKLALNQLASAVSECAWLPEEHSYSGFVRENEDGSFRYDNKILSLSWTNGFSVAVPLLLAANKMGDEEIRSRALDCMNYIMANCMNSKSDLPFDAYENGQWSVRGWWFDGMHSGGHSSYLTGQFVYYLLKAYENEKITRGIEHKDWIMFVKPIIQRVNAEKNNEEEYPFAYSQENGVGIEYDSFGSVWCLTATAYYEYLTGEETYREGMIRSEQCYYEKYVKKVECYGAPLDTDKAVDNEGILAYVRAVRLLHRITGDEKYLKHMKDGLNYEFTFKFAYNSPITVAPLSTIGWSSCGGSITSVANPHIHPMSSTIVGEMQYYVEQTGDQYVRDRMQDTVLWGCQTYNTYDGEYGYGRVGWMSERFCYSQGLVVEKYPDGNPASTWFALMPWASCSIIEGLVEYKEQ